MTVHVICFRVPARKQIIKNIEQKKIIIIKSGDWKTSKVLIVECWPFFPQLDNWGAVCPEISEMTKFRGKTNLMLSFRYFPFYIDYHSSAWGIITCIFSLYTSLYHFHILPYRLFLDQIDWTISLKFVSRNIIRQRRWLITF